jgi:magnesium-transporting ATPase (P-type)
MTTGAMQNGQLNHHGTNLETYDISAEDLSKFVDELQQRTFAEEIAMIESCGGEDKILEKLKTDKNKGIVSAHKDIRESYFGTNQKKKSKLKSLWEFFMEALNDFTLKILMVAAVVSIVVEMIHSERKELAWIEGCAISIAVLLSSGITTINDYNKQIQFAKLQELAEGRKEVNIYRDGETLRLNQ